MRSMRMARVLSWPYKVTQLATSRPLDLAAEIWLWGAWEALPPSASILSLLRKDFLAVLTG